MRRNALQQNPLSRRIAARSERSVGQLRSAKSRCAVMTALTPFDPMTGRARKIFVVRRSLWRRRDVAMLWRHHVPELRAGADRIGECRWNCAASISI